MRPAGLSPQSFADYPPGARALAIENIEILRQLPIAFDAVLLRELNGYDWRFPLERRMLDDQFTFLNKLSAAQRDDILREFFALSLPPELDAMDWVAAPQEFLDALTAHLWSTQQIGNFRGAASRFVEAWRKAIPEPAPSIPRLSIVFLDDDLINPGYLLFRKLRRHGVFFPVVDPTNAWPAVMSAVASRAVKSPIAYGHWYIDGGSPDPNADPRLTRVSWREAGVIRQGVLARMVRMVNSGHGGPEEARTLLAETTPRDLGLGGVQADEVLTRFQVSVLTEGSGTQIFSTTFAQWTAREALRRAQPCTLVLRYAARERQRPMNELIMRTSEKDTADGAGSLIDADMGAYYTWIDQQRLTGSEQSLFVAWSQAHKQAVAIGPGLASDTSSSNVPTMQQLLGYIL